MLTKNAHPFIMIAMILTAALCTPDTSKAQPAGDTPLQVAMLSPTPMKASLANLVIEQEYHRHVAEELKGLLYRELSTTERRALTGATAFIEVKYTGEGSFEVANVVSPNLNRLVTTLHRKMVWKSLPKTGRQPLSQKTARMEIGIDESGEVQINLELI